MITLRDEGLGDGTFIVEFDSIDELPEIFSTHMRGKPVDLFVAPGVPKGDILRAPGFIGSRMVTK